MGSSNAYQYFELWWTTLKRIIALYSGRLITGILYITLEEYPVVAREYIIEVNSTFDTQQFQHFIGLRP